MSKGAAMKNKSDFLEYLLPNMNEEREKNFFMFDLFQMPLQFSSVYKVFIKERNDY